MLKISQPAVFFSQDPRPPLFPRRLCQSILHGQVFGGQLLAGLLERRCVGKHLCVGSRSGEYE